MAIKKSSTSSYCPKDTCGGDKLLVTTTIMKQQQQQHQKRIRSRQQVVRFASFQENQVHQIENLNDMTPKEINACWYTSREYKSIWDDCVYTLKLLKRGRQLNTTFSSSSSSTTNTTTSMMYCGRGLESKSGIENRQKHWNRKQLQKVILQEQALQRQEECVKDHENVISNLSIYYSQTSVRLARNLARQDEIEVMYNHGQEEEAGSTICTNGNKNDDSTIKSFSRWDTNETTKKNLQKADKQPVTPVRRYKQNNSNHVAAGVKKNNNRALQHQHQHQQARGGTRC